MTSISSVHGRIEEGHIGEGVRLDFFLIVHTFEEIHALLFPFLKRGIIIEPRVTRPPKGVCEIAMDMRLGKSLAAGPLKSCLGCWVYRYDALRR